MAQRAFDIVRKRIIVCCDGTWQSSVSGQKNIPSNVTRLCRQLAKEGESVDNGARTLWKQVIWYDAGIGTGDVGFFDQLRQGGTGAGLTQNVVEAYNFIVMNYTPGDKIYCFGFSRGAYTARSLSGFITQFGVCNPMDLMAFPVLYSKYEDAVPPAKKNPDPKDVKRWERLYGKGGLKEKWLEGKAIDVFDDSGSQKFFTSGERKPIPEESKKVEVVGVWDTVGALGVPKILGWLPLPSHLLGKPGTQFHDVRVNDNVQHAYHALALDERRLPFSPTLWYIFKSQPRPKNQNFKQVWFPGVHINVGGGSDDILADQVSDFEQIANITFAWMVEQVKPYLAFNTDTFQMGLNDRKKVLEEIDGLPLPYPSKWYGKVGAFFSRMFGKLFGKPYPLVNAKRGWAEGPVVDSWIDGGPSMWLGGYRWRTPGKLNIPKSISDPGVENSDLIQTDESIHPSVFYRMQKMGTLSPALKGWRRQPADPKDPKKGWQWFNPETLITVPEYRIPNDASNLERQTAVYNGAGDFLKDIDAMYEKGEDKFQKVNYDVVVSKI